MTTARIESARNDRSFLRRLRSRSPLNSSRFWKWAVVVVAAAFAFDAARNAPPLFAADDAATKTAESPHDEPGGGHSDPVAPVLAAIVLILFFAKIGGDLFERFGMPAVLGELAVGIILGNAAYLTGWDGFDFLQQPEEGFVGRVYNTGAMIKILAGIGVVLLLFEVGLESSVREMMSVGTSSFLVAVLGVIAPMALGYVAGVLLLPDNRGWADWQVPAFIGATLCATSVGITARVLKDLGSSRRKESKIILGAAVIDDVLGLVVLAIVAGAITASGTSDGETGLGVKLVKIVGLALGFLAGAIFLGAINAPRFVFRYAGFLRGHGLLVASALVICFGFAWLANQVSLAPIVGAFAAGLILEGTHYRELGERENRNLEDALAPLSALLVPIFFVQMGIQVHLQSFADPNVWGLAATITVMAIAGKQVCALGVREKGLNRLAVGLGMIPRGEVGLIFANEGAKLMVDGHPVIDKGTFSAVVVMVMVTTMVTPPLLKWAMGRGDAKTANDGAGA
ncbi:MAG: cation:proton antiporter [Planctomycetaceae bacterium]